MTVWITGDIHSNPFRLSTDSFYEQKTFEGGYENNIVIQCGDFGIVWCNEESKEEKYKLDWLNSKNFTTVFVDGNHDNIPRLDSYPIKEWCGGLVNEIRPRVLRLRRGEVYTIAGHKFFAFGGASSHDISDGILDINDPNINQQIKQMKYEGKYMYRIKGFTYRTEELPSKEEMQNGISNLEKHNWQVDYIITHSPPASVIALLGHGFYEQDILTKYLEEIRCKLDFKRHFMGHMHVNKAVNDRDIILYEQIIRII